MMYNALQRQIRFSRAFSAVRYSQNVDPKHARDKPEHFVCCLHLENQL